MAKPFIARVKELMEYREGAELVLEAVARMEKWAMMSAASTVPLDDVAWLAAILLKANENAGHPLLKKELMGAHGSRVHHVVATDAVRTNDSTL